MPDSAISTAYRAAMEVIAASEPEVAEAIVGELESQRRQLKLIASENYASPAVLLAMGNWLSDKYAEGTPGPPALCGLRDGRPRGDSRRRPRHGALRRRSRVRSTALGHRRKPGRLLGDPRAPRRGPGTRRRQAWAT